MHITYAPASMASATGLGSAAFSMRKRATGSTAAWLPRNRAGQARCKYRHCPREPQDERGSGEGAGIEDEGEEEEEEVNKREVGEGEGEPASLL